MKSKQSRQRPLAGRSKQAKPKQRKLLYAALQPGDIVDIISPGSASKVEDLEQVLSLLESWQLRPRIYADQFSSHAFHSHEDNKRLEFLWRALTAKDSKMIWCLRGGYGANRLLPMLAQLKVPKAKKTIIGYSDISSLHILLQKWGWKSVHGPLLETLTSGRLHSGHLEEARKFVFGEKLQLEFGLVPMNEKAKKIKMLKGKTLASNLVVLQSTLGTDFQPRLKNCFLALEEIGERGYRVDRMLEHLEQAGVLKGCLGILFGDFLGGSEMDRKNYVNFAIERFAERNRLPCWKGLEIGHGEKNRMLTCGSDAILEGSREKALLRVDSIFKDQTTPRRAK